MVNYKLQITNSKLKKGDKVKVLLGKDRGKEAVIERLSHKKGLVWLPGINTYKRHVKANAQYSEGGVFDLVKPLNLSNVALVCPNCGKVTRVGYKVTKDSKVRICKKCHKEIA